LYTLVYYKKNRVEHKKELFENQEQFMTFLFFIIFIWTCLALQ
jgi:Trk-type K+ transport system membrane component